MKIRMKTKLLPLIFAIFLFCVVVSIVFAASFESSVSPDYADAGLINKFLNFTINNTETTSGKNITQVNITLPSGFSLVSGYNGTVGNSTPTTFTYDSTARNATWKNTTSTGFIKNGTKAYFWFNISIPKTAAGSYNFTISTLDTNNVYNLTNISITIEKTVWSSPLEHFYIKPTEIFLNWTNDYATNITITTNASLANAINITILNSSSGVSENYTQDNSNVYCQSGLYRLFVNDSAGRYNNSIDSLAPDSNVNYTIVDTDIVHNHLSCKPGRYWIQKFNTVNANQTDESANITVFIDIPISDVNTDLEFGVGSFNGKLPKNATTYHSYYFNTSIFPNATSVYINLTGWGSEQSVDMFLLDASGNLKAKSIDAAGTNESLLYSYLPKNEWWELRIFGNSTSLTSYTGKIAFSTLNTTNTSDSNKQVTSIDFGIMNTSETKNKYITLENEGTWKLSNIRETKDLYYVKKFGGSGSRNFTFFVPGSSINKVETVLNWTGGANYSFDVYNAANVLIGSSSGKYEYANTSGVMQEINNETATISSGKWRVQVTNNTNIADEYNVTVYLHVPASTWIKTNYSGEVLNSTGNPNSTRDIKINITIQNTTMDGLYKGYIAYLDGNNTGVKIPISFNVTTPILVVNDTFSSTTFRVDENYNTTLTRNVIINITNPGSYDLTVNITGAKNLSCASGGGCSGYNGSLSFNSTDTIPANGFTIIQANLSFNYSMHIGLYEGWIYVNGTNQTNFNLSARPFNTFNITLRLNLTDDLDVRILQIITNYGNAQTYNTSAENVTAKMKIYHINGTTEIDAKEAMNISNFSVYLTETNVTNYRIPTTGYLDLFNGTNPIYAGLPYYYSINFTVPANKPGGRYNVHVIANYEDSSRGFSYSGEGINNSLIINNTGLYMSAMNSTSISISNGSTYVFYVNVSNYGPIQNNSATITFSESCSGYSVSDPTYSSACSSFNVPAYNTSCYVYWTITAGSSAASACTGHITGSPTNNWFNPYGVNVSVTVTAPSGGTTSEGTTTEGTTTLPVYVANLSFTKAESIVSVVQNSSNTTEVQVKNIGNKTQNINFAITDINASWYTINATDASLLAGRKVGFLITFNIGMVDVKDYGGKYKAYSSEANVTSDFVIRVLPAEEKQTEISNELAVYRVNMTKIWDEINKTKLKGVNTTLAEEKIIEAKSKIELAESYIAAGNYFEAYQLFRDIKSLINDAKVELETAKEIYAKSHLPNWMTWAFVGAGILIAGFLIYLLWPQPGYSPKTGKYTYKTPKERSMEALSSAKKKIVSKIPGIKPKTAYKPSKQPLLKLSDIEIKQPITKIGRYTIQKSKTAQEKFSGKISKIKDLFKKKRKYKEIEL